MPKVYDLLVLPPQKEPVYFIVERDTDEEYITHDHAEFLYNEHSCPVNWLRPIHVQQEADTDPHGLIEYVETKRASEMPKDENYGPNERDFAFDAWVKSKQATRV